MRDVLTELFLYLHQNVFIGGSVIEDLENLRKIAYNNYNCTHYFIDSNIDRTPYLRSFDLYNLHFDNKMCYFFLPDFPFGFVTGVSYQYHHGAGKLRVIEFISLEYDDLWDLAQLRLCYPKFNIYDDEIRTMRITDLI